MTTVPHHCAPLVPPPVNRRLLAWLICFGCEKGASLRSQQPGRSPATSRTRGGFPRRWPAFKLAESTPSQPSGWRWPAFKLPGLSRLRVRVSQPSGWPGLAESTRPTLREAAACGEGSVTPMPRNLKGAKRPGPGPASMGPLSELETGSSLRCPCS